MITSRRQISKKQQREEEAKRKREQTLKSIREDITQRGITLSFNLSNDITTEILSRVPVEDLLRFKFACKSWYTLLHDLFFIRLHLNHTITNNKSVFMIYKNINDIYSVDCDISSSSLKLSRAVKIDSPFKFAHIHVFGSCNGIFLIQTYHQFSRIGLWNPFTREYKDLPQNFPNYPKPLDSFEIKFCLGYDASRDDYKVIRYPYYKYHSINSAIPMSDVDVYSMRTNSCKRIQDVPYYIFGSVVFPNLSCDNGNGIMLNGAIHWLGKLFSDATDGFSLKIVSFDLASDEFKDLQLPDVLLDIMSKRLGALEECLCIYHVNEDNYYIDVFMMKEYGVKESWAKMFSIIDQQIWSMNVFKPMCVTKDGKLLAHWNYRGFALYDSKHGGRGDFKIQGIPKNILYFSSTCTCVKSLVSLGANTYM